MAKKKIEIYKFTEEELSMYNSMMVGAMTRLMFNKMVEAGIDYDKIVEEIFPVEYLRNGSFEEDLDRETEIVSNGNFDMGLFKYEEEIDE